MKLKYLLQTLVTLAVFTYNIQSNLIPTPEQDVSIKTNTPTVVSPLTQLPPPTPPEGDTPPRHNNSCRLPHFPRGQFLEYPHRLVTRSPAIRYMDQLLVA